MIFIDAPVGVGFSYSTTQQGYIIDDYKSATQTSEFMKKVCKSIYHLLIIIIIMIIIIIIIIIIIYYNNFSQFDYNLIIT